MIRGSKNTTLDPIVDPWTPSPEKGVAVLIVLVSVAILTILVFELAFSTGVQSRLARTFNATAQAKYLAKSAQNLSLLRLYVYMNLIGLLRESKQPLSPQDIADIYRLPLPPFPFDENMMGLFPVAVRIGLEKFARESVVGQMPGAQFASDIRGLSGSMPINFLDGEPERFSSKKFQEVYQTLLSRMIDKKMEENEKLKEKYAKVLPEDFVWGLINYIDLDNIEQPTGQLEDTYFQQFYPPEFLRHRRFQFTEEISLARYWDDYLLAKFAKFFNLFAFYPYININDASSEILSVLLGKADEEQMNALQEKLVEGGFKQYDEIDEFRKAQGVTLEEDKDPFQRLIGFYEQTAFKITATGIVGGLSKDYAVVVVFKPNEKKLNREVKRIQAEFKKNQDKMEETGDIENEEFNKWKEDPFKFFESEKDSSEADDSAEPVASEEENSESSGKPNAAAKNSNGKKPKGSKIINIFNEPPEQMQIVYWGDPI